MKENKVGIESVWFDGECICITAEDFATVYEISKCQLVDYEDCVKWLAQLSQKRWFTSNLTKMFIEVFAQVSGLQIYGLR